MADEPDSITELLDRLRDAGDEDRVSLRDMLGEIGRRSFGPVLTFAGLVVLAPVVGDIPGVPTTIGVLVLLVVGQVMFAADHIWLPKLLLDRSIARAKLDRALGWLRKPAGWVDRVTHARWTTLVRGATGRYLIGGLALLVAIALPGMELVPLSANAGGLALTLLGVSLLTEDGVVAAIGAAVIAATLGLGVWALA